MTVIIPDDKLYYNKTIVKPMTTVFVGRNTF